MTIIQVGEISQYGSSSRLLMRISQNPVRLNASLASVMVVYLAGMVVSYICCGRMDVSRFSTRHDKRSTEGEHRMFRLTKPIGGLRFIARGSRLQVRPWRGPLKLLFDACGNHFGVLLRGNARSNAVRVADVVVVAVAGHPVQKGSAESWPRFQLE